jgi:YHS domain-containing protein
MTSNATREACGPEPTSQSESKRLCPVMRNPVAEDTPYRVSYQGQEYLLCCSVCTDEFNANPDYFARVAKQLNTMAG